MAGFEVITEGPASRFQINLNLSVVHVQVSETNLLSLEVEGRAKPCFVSLSTIMAMRRVIFLA